MIELCGACYSLPGFSSDGNQASVEVVTFKQVYQAELAAAGVSVCIYANHLLRASYPSMLGVAESILTHKRSLEADEVVMPIKNILTLIDDNTGA